jgi:hypothetical protein
MRREDGMETRRPVAVQDRVTPRRLTKRDLDRRIEAISLEVVKAFESVEAEKIEYLGETIWAKPMDARRFIKIMSRYISLN